MADDLGGQLKVIAEWATRLRAVGVHSLAIGEISMVLLPPDPGPIVDIGPTAQPMALLDDAETYGLPEGASVPGFTRPDDL